MPFPSIFADLKLIGPQQFSFNSMTAAVLNLPSEPDDIDWFLTFQEEGHDSDTIVIDSIDELGFQLIPWGTPDAPMAHQKRESVNSRAFTIPYVGVQDQVLAHEVRGLREAGTVNAFMKLGNLADKRLRRMRANLDITARYHKFKAATEGVILNPDDPAGDPLVDLFDMWDVTQAAVTTINFGTITNTEFLAQSRAISREMRKRLRGTQYGGLVGIMGEAFAEAMFDNQSIHDIYARATAVSDAFGPNFENDGQPASFSRANLAYGGFKHGGILWREFFTGDDISVLKGETETTAVQFMESDMCYVLPAMPRGTYRTIYGPDARWHTVNETGLPMYAATKNMDWDSGIQMRSWSYPFYLNTRPQACYRLKLQ